ncbi:MAG: lysophospholipid acyltransferase family protein [Rhodospirillales bacterium]
MFRYWSKGAVWLMRVVAGIDVHFVGLEKIPNGPILIASKHQSIWDTFIMYVILEDPQYILKQELMKIPFWGWYNRRVEHVSVDRYAGAKALRHMVTACVDRVVKGRQVIIFPEGTRTAPGEQLRYHPGVAAVYQQLPDGVAVVPIALNSGKYWGRRKFLVSPGTITLEVLDPVMAGAMPRKVFMAHLERVVEEASTRLLVN